MQSSTNGSNHLKTTQFSSQVSLQNNSADSGRILSPYEQNHLRKFGVSFDEVDWQKEAQTPVEYLTGKVEFYNHVFHVSPETMIPRVETEELVDLAVQAALDVQITNKQVVFAEIGTGSGAAGISLFFALQNTKQWPKVVAFLSDISEAALTVTHKNWQTVADSTPDVTILQSDLLKNFTPNLRFNLLIANLPYIPSARIPYLDESVIGHEPLVSLDGGPDGLTLIHRLLNEAPPYLEPKAKILLEVDYTHTIEEILTHTQQFTGQMIKDQFDRQRFAILEYTP